jgi:activator of HSP90 ATPase
MNTTDTASSLSSTRRQWMTGLAVAVGGLAFVSSDAWAADDNGLSHNAEAIHQETVIKASPQRIYDALTSADQFQKIVIIGGAIAMADIKAKPAQISREPGGAFSLFGGYIVGRQLELVPAQRIVQAWREISWEPGIFSIARFELKQEGSETRLIFDHTGFPAGAGDHLAIGWKSHYWEPLEKLVS